MTHNHPEGIKGAQAVADAIFMARTDKSKREIKKFVLKKLDKSMQIILNEFYEKYLAK